MTIYAHTSGHTGESVVANQKGLVARMREERQACDGQSGVAPFTRRWACPPIDWSSLSREPPARTWWMDEWLTPAPTLVAGAGGLGKSLLLQGICTALATRSTYITAPPESELNCLVWACEDDCDEIHRRQVNLNSHFGLSNGDLQRLHIVPRAGMDNTLLGQAFGKPVLTDLVRYLNEQVNDLKADVLVIDNIAQVFGGVSADAHQVTSFVNAIAGLVKDRPFAPVLVGHVSRTLGSEFAGSAAWENAVRMRWMLASHLPGADVDDSPVGNDTVYLAKRKANYARREAVKLRFERGVLLPVREARGLLSPEERLLEAEAVVIDGLRVLNSRSEPTASSPTSSCFLPRMLVRHDLSNGLPMDELRRAMEGLIVRRRIQVATIGKYVNGTARRGLVASDG